MLKLIISSSKLSYTYVYDSEGKPQTLKKLI